MSCIFSPDDVRWDILMSNVQYGSGFGYFQGMPYQRGSGIGSILRSVIKFLIPLGKQAGYALAREGLDTVSRVIQNSANGDIKNVVKTETKRGMKNLLTKAADHVDPQTGGGKRKKIQKKVAFTKIPPKKKGKHDALGFY